MPTKTAVAFLMFGILLASVPGAVYATEGTRSGSLSPAQLEKVEQIEQNLASERNHPLRQLWEIFSRTTVTGFVVDRIWSMFQNYGEQRRYREATDLKERRENGTIKESPNRTTKTFEGNPVTPTAPARAGVKPSAPAGTPRGVETKGGATPAQTIPSGSNKRNPEEEESKKKGSNMGSAALAAFSGGVDEAVSWVEKLLGK